MRIADPAVLGLGGRGRGGVVEVAARHLEAGADGPDAIAGGLVNVVDHLAELQGSLVPRITAASFKMLFSWRSKVASRRRARSSSAAELGALRIVPPVVEKVAADAEFFGDLGDGFAGAQQFDGLCFELGGVSLTGC